MYTQYQRFIATILLFSILLQSCGNPKFKIVEEGTLQAPPKPQPLKLLQAPAAQEAPTPELPVAQPSKPLQWAAAGHTPPQRRPGQLAQKPSSPKQPARHGALAAKPSSPTQVRTKLQQPPQPRLPSPPKASPPAKAAQPAPPPAPTPATPPPAAAVPCRVFTASGGAQVAFSQVEGNWQAQEVFGYFSRKLPIVCKGDLEAKLQELQDKPDVYTRHRLHILATDQPPYAPRCVYVGKIGLRGGGNKPCTYPPICHCSL